MESMASHMHYEVTGSSLSKQTVCFIHGLCCDLTDWEHQRTHFQDRYRVIGCDLKGHGYSAAPVEPVSIEDWAADIAELLAAADINIETLDAEEVEGADVVTLSVDHYNRALAALRDAGYPAVTEDALLVRVEDEPGALAKVVLSLQHNKIPASLNYSGPNPYIQFDANGLKVNAEAGDWPRYSGHAIAGVSGFGFGGTNASLLFKRYAR